MTQTLAEPARRPSAPRPAMATWKYKKVSGNFYPRQFEFHPDNEAILFGTIFGEICTVDLETNNVEIINQCGVDDRDTILALCWLKGQGNLFLSGSARGRICLGDITRGDEIVHEFEKFEKLTSAHVDCLNSTLLVSGYSTTVSLFDIETGKKLRAYSNVHKDHINISRFTNHCPHVFGTSSFDGSIKLWDLRQRSVNADGPDHSEHRGTTSHPANGNQGQIYTLQCNSGVVMINFSVDDSFILASAQDNEINQYCLLNGRRHSRFDLLKTGLSGNFTRAYYSATGRHAITGACEQSSVKLLCSHTGSYLSSVSMTPVMRDPSIYVQSLRGSPRDDFKMCVLTNYRDIPARELIYVQAAAVEKETLPSSCGGKCNDDESSVEQDLLVGTRTLPINMPSYSFLDQMFDLRIVADQASRDIQSSPVPAIADLSIGDPRHDLILLAYPPLDGVLPSVQAVHGFVLVARCPVLQAIAASGGRGDCAVDLSAHLTVAEWELVPLLIDFLYVGLAALDLVTFRRYALRSVPEEERAFLCRRYADLMDATLSVQSDEDEPDLPPPNHWLRMEKLLPFDECCWRQEEGVNLQLLLTLIAFHSLGQKLQLDQCVEQAIFLLSRSIVTCNAVEIWRWTQLQHYPDLAEMVVKFVICHRDVVEGCEVEEGLQRAIARIRCDQEVEAVSRSELERRLTEAEDWITLQSDPAGMKAFRQLQKTWMMEEAPLLPKVGYLTPATCLSQYLWHASCNVMDDSIIYFGGMSKDRLNGFSRLLVYDVSADSFRYVQCSGTEVPTSAYMHQCFSLQKHRPTNIVVYGGKLKFGEVGSRVAPVKRSIAWDVSPLESHDVPHPYNRTNPSLPSRVRDYSKAFVYELNYSKLTWVRKAVQLVNRAQRFARNSERLFHALQSRVAQSTVVVYAEDLSYRCPLCLFQQNLNAVGGCTHARDSGPLQVSWALQFAGYCPQQATHVADVFVLKSFFDPETQDFQHEWMEVSPTGTPPPGRFSHAACFLPAKSCGTPLRYDRMVVVGGVVPDLLHQVDAATDLQSLRISRTHEVGDVRWETVRVGGSLPPKLYGHCMVHIPGTNTLVVTGGIHQTTREFLNMETYLLALSESETNGATTLQATWSLLRAGGIPPETRSRFSTNVCPITVDDRSCNAVFVFGGHEEIRGEQEPDDSSENHTRDCVMHRLLLDVAGQPGRNEWLSRVTESKVLWADSKPTVVTPTCTLGVDLKRLVFVGALEKQNSIWPTPLQPDLQVMVEVEGEGETAIRVFSTLVAHRSPMLRAALSNGMIEAQTRTFRMPPGPAVSSVVQLLEFLCCDHLPLSSVQQAVDMLELGNQQDLRDLIKRCEGSLLRLVERSTVCDLLEYAQQYDLELLRLACYSLLLKSGDETLRSLLAEEPKRSELVEECNERPLSEMLSIEALADFQAFAKTPHVYQLSLPQKSM